MPASAAARYGRMLDTYRRMLVTDICSIVYKSSWLSQSLDFGVGQIYVFSASALFLVLSLPSVICSFLDRIGAPGPMVPDCVKFASYH